MGLYRDEGIVLRTHKLGEADRIVSVLTRGRGKVRAVAKGVRKTKSRFGARLEPPTHLQLLLWYSLTAAKRCSRRKSGHSVSVKTNSL